jgi:hypothetical protein
MSRLGRWVAAACISVGVLIPVSTPASAHPTCSLDARVYVLPSMTGGFFYGQAHLECSNTHYKYRGKIHFQRRIRGSWQNLQVVGYLTDCCNKTFGPSGLESTRYGCAADGLTDRFRVLVDDIYTISTTGNIAHRVQTALGPVLTLDCAADGQPS